MRSVRARWRSSRRTGRTKRAAQPAETAWFQAEHCAHRPDPWRRRACLFRTERPRAHQRAGRSAARRRCARMGRLCRRALCRPGRRAALQVRARCAGSHRGIQGRLDPARAAGRGRPDPGAKAKRQQGGQRPGYRNQQHPREQLRARRAGRLQRRAGRSSARQTQRDAECHCLPARPHGRAWLDRARRGRGRADRGHRRQTATSRTTVRTRSPQRCDPASMPA